MFLALYLCVKPNKGSGTNGEKTIMLACSAGMSTSLLVTKMQKAAEEKGMEADILLFRFQMRITILNLKT